MHLGSGLAHHTQRHHKRAYSLAVGRYLADELVSDLTVNETRRSTPNLSPLLCPLPPSVLAHVAASISDATPSANAFALLRPKVVFSGIHSTGRAHVITGVDSFVVRHYLRFEGSMPDSTHSTPGPMARWDECQAKCGGCSSPVQCKFKLICNPVAAVGLCRNISKRPVILMKRSRRDLLVATFLTQSSRQHPPTTTVSKMT